jgi:hypothetical protein
VTACHLQKWNPDALQAAAPNCEFAYQRGPIRVPVNKRVGVEDALAGEDLVQVEFPFPEVTIDWKPLVEIADLDEVLGYKGNYAIYRLKQNNYLALHMMQSYLELSDEITVRDPDDVANYTVEELQELVPGPRFTVHLGEQTDHAMASASSCSRASCGVR